MSSEEEEAEASEKPGRISREIVTLVCEFTFFSKWSS